MVGIVIVSHSAKIAEGVVELARQMGGGDVKIAAAGGVDDPDNPIGTDAFAIKQAIESVWSDDGVVVLMDLGSAVMNAETALDFLEPPAKSAGVRLCEAPLVEGAVAAAATARLGATASEVAAEARRGLASKQRHLGVEVDRPRPEPEVGGDARAVELRVPNPLGLHMRPAARLVETAAEFDARVEIRNVTTDSQPASARSLSQVSSLGAVQGHQIEVRAEGPEAAEVLEAITRLAADNFGDRPGRRRPPTPASPRETRVEGELVGVGASPGVAIGPVRHLRQPDLEIPETQPMEPASEWARLSEALASGRQVIASQRDDVTRRVGVDEAGIFSAHLMILSDDALIAGARARIEDGASAELAWDATIEEARSNLARVDDAYQAERVGDLSAVGRIILGRLLNVDITPKPTGSGVLFARDLTPGETAQLDPEVVNAIVTSAGGATSHSAILARALGVPAVVAVGAFDVAEGVTVVVDGDSGTVIVDPTPEAVAAAERRRLELARRVELARSEASQPATTLGGLRIEVAANVGSLADAQSAAEAGADGVGLLRTEFLFLDRQEPPSVAEQYEVYGEIAAAMNGGPITLRTLDIGGDKPVPFVSVRPEENPFLGVRGLRLGLSNPELLVDQLTAVLRVAHEHPLRVMFPMVTTVAEWDGARALVARAGDAAGGIPEGLELGIMVEVPAVALTAARFAPLVDFFSIGTNDLTQYTMAAERGNPELTELADPLHPGVLSLIDMTCRAAAEHGRWVGVCGEAAGDTVAIPLLLGLGVTELSMAPVSISLAKQTVRATDDDRARRLAADVLGLRSADEVRARLSDELQIG